MYHFLQFKPNKKESWKMFDVKQLDGLDKKPAFMTVLAVDQDPEILAEAGEEPIEHVKYFGPMYWDFDGEDIDEVLNDVRQLLDWLTQKMHISKQFIHCWLSGGRGVHILVPAAVWGVKGPTKYLPYIYREIAHAITLPTLDLSVYSCGRGRMWRCEGVARPGRGTYKVGVSVEELYDMDAKQYEVLIAAPRPPLDRQLPDKNLVFPQAESLLKVARTAANKKVRALMSQTSVPDSVLSEIEGVPGCIEKLITEGDCPDSNWNQAAMQLASYIAAKYSREDKDEYEDLLVTPFVENVESSTRPTPKERRKHVHEQLNRAFAGRIKFTLGPLIATLGTPCGDCILCSREKRAEAETGGEGMGFCNETQIQMRPTGFYLLGENNARQLTSFTFQMTTEVTQLDMDEEEYSEGRRIAMRGTLRDDKGTVFEDFEIPEQAWASRRDLLHAVTGRGSSVVYCSDVETQKIMRAVLSLSGEPEKLTKTPVCGVILYRANGSTIPHYVESGGSFTQRGAPSHFMFAGDPAVSPNLLETDPVIPGDPEVDECLTQLCRSNEPEAVAPALGWVVACAFREHFQSETNQFPLLNLSGGAGAGKSSFATLLLHLSGMDYARTDFVNVEISTLYPLIRFVTSSTTVPRLVEEVNPGLVKQQDYKRIVGIFKASWSASAIPRGFISGRDLKVTADRVTSPIVYTSEQPPMDQALRSRSVEVRLTSRALRKPEYVKAYKAAHTLRTSLHRVARMLVQRAMNTSPKALLAIHAQYEDRIPEVLGQRPIYSMQVAFTGLHILEDVLRQNEIHGAADAVLGLIDSWTEALNRNSRTLGAEKSLSEADRVLAAMDQMILDREDMALEAGIHYWRQGNLLYLHLAPSMPRYLRYIRSLGDHPIIRDHLQLGSLIEGEIYYVRTDDHPSKPGARVHVIDIDVLRTKGTVLTNFQDGTDPE